MSWSRCKFCGEKVLWAEMPDGQKLPFDYDSDQVHGCVERSVSSGDASGTIVDVILRDPFAEYGSKPRLGEVEKLLIRIFANEISVLVGKKVTYSGKEIPILVSVPVPGKTKNAEEAGQLLSVLPSVILRCDRTDMRALGILPALKISGMRAAVLFAYFGAFSMPKNLSKEAIDNNLEALGLKKPSP